MSESKFRAVFGTGLVVFAAAAGYVAGSVTGKLHPAVPEYRAEEITISHATNAAAGDGKTLVPYSVTAGGRTTEYGPPPHGTKDVWVFHLGNGVTVYAAPKE